VIHRIVVPDLGATGGDVELIDWLTQPGDFVATGAPIFVLTTDKANVEVEAFRGGYIRQILITAGNRVALGTVVALMSDSADEPLVSSPETTPNQVLREGQEQAASDLVKGSTRSGPSGRLTEVGKEVEQTDNVAGALQPDLRVLASPLARRIAEEQGIDLRTVRSAQPGPIHEQDVLNEVRAKSARVQEKPASTTIPVSGRQPLSPIRRAIAEKTSFSKAHVPHFYATVEIDVTDGLEFLRTARELAKERSAAIPSFTDLVVRAASLAVRCVPQLNASWQGGEILHFAGVNVGLVIGLSEGMVVPVVEDADRKSLYQLAAVRRRLQERASAGILSRSDLGRSTITISNLGKYGVDSFIAVINPPEAAILAIGAIRKRPAVRNGSIVIRDSMTATLSADHRVVDGIPAAQFLSRFKQNIEDPLTLACDNEGEFAQ
jgi:pyruvate dehydrogenase E2 component (dihydrolipoamide acetyltransferase)